MKRSRTLRKGLSLQSIRRAVEFSLDVNIAEVSRKKKVVQARAYYYYMAAQGYYTHHEAAKEINQEHSNAVYHTKKIKHWVAMNDKETCTVLDSIFKTKLYKTIQELEYQKYKEDTQKLSKEVLAVMDTIPSQNRLEALERIKAIAKAYNFKAAK